jgi:hypothetical protein
MPYFGSTYAASRIFTALAVLGTVLHCKSVDGTRPAGH